MNDAEPSPKEVAGYEDSLRHHQTAVVFYNQQMNKPLTRRFLEIAKSGGVPVVGGDEFVPLRTGYTRWPVQTPETLDKALAVPAGATGQ